VTVLVDTSAFFALLDVDDDDRAPAAAALERLQADEEPLVTHEYVIVETISLVQRRLGMGALRRFVDDLLPLVDVEWVDPALHAEAREAMLAAGQRGVSLVDWTSFLVMRRRGIRTAFAFDDDFAAQGFQTLPA
jgi:predicted nucleic acid-binding protein